MKKTTLLIMALATLLTTACTVSDNPSSGGDNNTGAGDHNVRRYMPITANTEKQQLVGGRMYGRRRQQPFLHEH